MKKFTHLFLLASFILVTSNTLFAQAKKYPLFEHFTQASCPPCATQNPYFDAVYQVNKTNVHHISYHTSWPGYDPMYDFNSAESDQMVSYYGVTGVPDMFMNGTNMNSPANITQDVVDNATTSSSPIRILVSETTTGSTRNVTVEVQTVGTVPAGSYKFKASVVESVIEYGTPPGTNGETVFPNVMREFLTGTGGVSYTPAAIGSSVTYTYSYTLDAAYVESNIYVLGWVQNVSTKEVINSGATGDPAIEVVNTSANTFASGTNTFTGTVTNLGDANSNLSITLDSEQPADWSSSFNYDGVDYTSSTSIVADANSISDISVKVTAGSTAGVGSYTLTVTSLDDPSLSPMILRYYSINGVTDLIVNNNSGFGDGSPYGTWDWQSYYEAGLSYAGITTSGATTDNVFIAGMKANALSGVENIYYNVGWTFPSLGKNELRDYLADFLDGGGNLFISGQDIGWEIDDDASTYAFYEPRDFYRNYLHADFVADAASGASQFSAVSSDIWFGTTPTSDIADIYSSGGNDYYYPDQVEPYDAEGYAIFNYNNDGAKIAGIRSETAEYKTVYLAIGLEMIGDEAIRNQVMKNTYLYFKGEVSGIAFDNAMQNLLGSAYPNPAQSSATIQINNLNKDMIMVVSDITGKIVKQVNISNGTSSYKLNVEDMNAGMYFYYLTDGKYNSATQKLNIIK